MSIHEILRKLSRLIPDKSYLRLKYHLLMKKKLHLRNPQTFNEKLQWLKIYDRKPIYSRMVDKCDAKDFVAQIIGKQYIVSNYGIWDTFDDIDFAKLPSQFVLKCTHDSGGLVIVRNKAAFDIVNARKKINDSLHRDFYWIGREWPYKGLKPRVFAEKYMEDGLGGGKLIDYKFYCFNGVPRYLYVSQGMENHSNAHISFLTPDWHIAPFGRTDYKPFRILPNKPENYDEMLEIAKTLSRGITFLRVDLYSINGKTYFSELTFFPCGGFMPFSPEEFDLKLGKELSLKLV